MKFVVLFFILSITSLSWAFEKQELVFDNGKKLVVEVADDHEKRAQGLMNRTKLGENEGMLFVFTRPQSLSFWMKDTYIDLSIAYFDKDKSLKEIYDMKGQSMMEKVQDFSNYPSKCRCQYALEVNKGWFKKHGIKEGASFKLQSLKK